MLELVHLLFDEGGKKLDKDLTMEEVLISVFSLFVGNGYEQHDGADWKSQHTLQYYTYVILGGRSLEDAEVFSGDCSLSHPEELASGSTAGKHDVWRNKQRTMLQ